MNLGFNAAQAGLRILQQMQRQPLVHLICIFALLLQISSICLLHE
jgi:hypothetical protein